MYQGTCGEVYLYLLGSVATVLRVHVHVHVCHDVGLCVCVWLTSSHVHTCGPPTRCMCYVVTASLLVVSEVCPLPQIANR